MSHYEPFKSLAPIAWNDLDHADLESFFDKVFSDGQTVIDSIPSPAGLGAASGVQNTKSGGRARSATESAVEGPRTSFALDAASVGQKGFGGDAEAAAKLQKEWKDIKVGSGPRDNPHDIRVYKLASKDGRGSWFARRSLHEGLPFEKWKLGLEREFAETLKRNAQDGGEPGTGNIRGIGAERRVEKRAVKGTGKLEVYQLSARFPGPTTPRDFITLLLSSDNDASSAARDRQKRPRQLMIISKPCNHPKCPPRQGFIRGQYESVEIIREVALGKPLRRTQSSIDISREEFQAGAKAAKRATEHSIPNSPLRKVAFCDGDVSIQSSKSDMGASEPENMEMAIEWLMVTRSDPGGSVPRFMVEKGTPGGIVTDAGKFVKWLAQKSAEDFASDPDEDEEDDNVKEDAVVAERRSLDRERPLRAQSESRPVPICVSSPAAQSERSSQPEEATPSGFYGMIAGALGAAGIAGSVMAKTVSSLTGSARNTDVEDNNSEEQDEAEQSDAASEEEDYASTDEGESPQSPPNGKESPAGDKLSMRSARSVSEASKTSEPASVTTTMSSALTQHEKELKKLQGKHRRAQEKAAKTQERSVAKRREDSGREAAAAAKLREKHEREMARQEERYRRELKKLEEKRAAEEKKAAKRQRKALEREEKAGLQAELDRTRAEKDLAIKEIALLKAQVGELQRQNTMLVARLGRVDESS